MTTSSGPASMRFALHEVLSGMLGSTQSDSFTDDTARLAAMFESLAGRFALFAPFAAGVEVEAVTKALETLEKNKIIEHGEGRYLITPAGRASCLSSKRTLFNRGDIQQLEEAAPVFDTL
ncbi:MAG: hypothetical protein EXR50_03140 [Dehalococcoidia bacterium]|nr:hypothetical protein [Dehalococcoidia bacterium]